MTRLYWHLLIGALLSLGSLGILLALAASGVYSDLMATVFVTGTAGAVVNNYFRLSRLSEMQAEALQAPRAKVLAIQMYVSLLIAGALAFAVFGMFISGLVQGSLFPQFGAANASYESMTGLVSTLAPATNMDAMKAIIWGFIAGFSEKLVPNLIDRIVESGSKEDKR